MSKTARPRAKLSRRELRWAGGGIVCLHLTVARIAEGLGVSWNTVNKAVLTEGRCMLIDAPDRFDGVKVIGVTSRCGGPPAGEAGGFPLSVIPPRSVTGPSRLLGRAEGRSKQAFATWLQERTPHWRNGVEVVAMDVFSGFKSAAAEELPAAVALGDPAYSVRRTLHAGADLLTQKQ